VSFICRPFLENKDPSVDWENENISCAVRITFYSRETADDNINVTKKKHFSKVGPGKVASAGIFVFNQCI